MKTIACETTHVYEIQKSKFICRMVPVFSLEEVKQKLEAIKQEYVGATHYCYAYIIKEKKRCSDDGEPSGTAGMPILHVLENQNFSYILCIVVRYFGGIKLGAGGLLRAYTKSVTDTLSTVLFATALEGVEVQLSFPYSDTKTVEYLLRDSTVINKVFSDFVIYTIQVSKKDFESLIECLPDSVVILGKKEVIMTVSLK